MLRPLAFLVCVAVIATVPLTLTGCGGSKGESAVAGVVDVYNELADRLAKITTKEQLAAAEPDIRKIGEKVKAAMEQMKVLDTLPKEENEAIGKELGPKMAAARAKAFTEIDRITSTIDPLAGDRIEVMLGVR